MSNQTDAVNQLISNAKREAEIILHISVAFDKALEVYGSKNLAQALMQETVCAATS